MPTEQVQMAVQAVVEALLVESVGTTIRADKLLPQAKVARAGRAIVMRLAQIALRVAAGVARAMLVTQRWPEERAEMAEQGCHIQSVACL